MRISSNNKLYANSKYNFTARSPEIRFADDIARRINQCYPRISSTNIEDFAKITLHQNFLNRLKNQINALRGIIISMKAQNDIPLKFFIDTIKKYKLGNCGESTVLAEIAARINGIEDCISTRIYQRKGLRIFDLDHQVLLVENKNKFYIIDPWLGFADYVPNALKRYEGEYSHHFNFKPKNPETKSDRTKIVFKPHYGSMAKRIFSKNYTQEELQTLCPELIVRRTSGSTKSKI